MENAERDEEKWSSREKKTDDCPAIHFTSHFCLTFVSLINQSFMGGCTMSKI